LSPATNIDLTLLIGSSNPTPAPRELMQAIQFVEVQVNDEDRSGFQVGFQAAKSGSSTSGFPIVNNGLLQVFNRVIIQVNLFGTRTVLIDGLITHQQLQPGKGPAGSLYTITGEDVGVAMDLNQVHAQFPGQDESQIVTQLLGSYSRYGITPKVSEPPLTDTPDPNEYLLVQRATDYELIVQLAKRFGFVFRIQPGSTVGQNVAYWGPPYVDGTPQKSVSIDSGPATNTGEETSLQYDGLQAMTISGQVQDRITDEITELDLESDDAELTALSSGPGISSQSLVRKVLLPLGEGRTASEATAYAQGMIDEASSRVSRLSGSLDSVRYGAVLKTRALVDVRGGATRFDGKFYVKQVVHRFSRRTYTQRFTLTREGAGAAESAVQT
jgi:hypothetical protein